MGVEAVEVDELLCTCSLKTASYAETRILAATVCTAGFVLAIVPGDGTVVCLHDTVAIIARPVRAVLGVVPCAVTRYVGCLLAGRLLGSGLRGGCLVRHLDKVSLRRLR